MEKIQIKIEKYLKKQFPKMMIIRASKKEMDPNNEHIYGFMRMMISVYPKEGKIYYKLNKIK